MALRASASCAAFDVSTRKVPSLALVPRGHLKHATRAKKKVVGSSKLGSKADDVKQQDTEAAARTEDSRGATSQSPPLPTRRQKVGDILLEAAEEQQRVEDESEEDEDDASDDDSQVELRLGERFLNVMALMTRLADQSSGDNSTLNSPVSRPITRGNTERALSPIVRSTRQESVKSPVKSPKHVVRDVAKRLPRTLQGQLTFDICMLLPAPVDERQSPLRSPIRRKRLRKRVRRRRLRCRARRTWQSSHASWPHHASADYIVDHSRQDIAGINATRLVERLGEWKVNMLALPRVLSMPLPPLNRNSTHVQAEKSVQVGSVGEQVEDEVVSDGNEHDNEDDDSEQKVDEEEEDDESDIEDEETSEPRDTADTLSPREPQGHGTDKLASPATTRALYHQPAWISPELHTWLVESGLFATKPRRELLSTGS